MADPFSSAIASAIQAIGAPPAKRNSLLATRFQQAKFKGVPFFIEQVESDFGRRTVDREYPKRDDPYSEDLGRKARDFTFEAFVLGENYEAQRDALIKACEAPYAGPLIHPYLGLMQVVCKGCKVRERKDALGMAVISLTFKEAGKSIFPSASTDDTLAIVSAALAVTDASAANLQNNFSVLGAPAYLLSAAQTRIGQVADLVNAASTAIKTKLQAIQDFAFAVKNLKAKVLTLINTPALLAAQIHDTINLLSSIIPGGDRTAAMLAYQALYNVAPLTFQLLDSKSGKSPLTVLPASTVNSIRMTQMEQAISDHVARVAIAAAASEAVTNVYASLDDAIVVQTTLVAKLDAMAQATGGDDNVYQALVALRAQVFKSIPPSGQMLPDIVIYTPKETVPSLVVAYDLYEASSFADDLVQRNKIRNPSFIPGLKALSVLRGVS